MFKAIKRRYFPYPCKCGMAGYLLGHNWGIDYKFVRETGYYETFDRCHSCGEWGERRVLDFYGNCKDNRDNGEWEKKI